MESTILSQEELVSNKEVEPSSSGCYTKKMRKSYVCGVCGKSCSRKNNLHQHMLTHSGEKSYSCDVCEIPFARKNDLKRHKLSHLKVPTQHKCDKCNEMFLHKSDLLKHRKIHSKTSVIHKCDKCSEVFPRKEDLKKHAKTHKSPKQHKCDECDKVFSRKCDLYIHVKTHKSPKQHKCVECSEACSSKSALLRHMRTSHTEEKPKSNDASLRDMLFEKVKHFQRQNALGVFTKTMFLSNEENNQDFVKFFDSLRLDIFNELTYQMEVKKSFKWYAVVQAILTRESKDGETESATPYFHSSTILQLNNGNLASNIEEAFVKMTRSFEKFTQSGSAWTLEKILHLELSIAKYGMA